MLPHVGLKIELLQLVNINSEFFCMNSFKVEKIMFFDQKD